MYPCQRRTLAWSLIQTGKIGDDNIGDEFLRTLREDGVDAELVAVKKGGTTLHTYILTAPGGRHCIFANTGDTVCTLIPEELPEEEKKISFRLGKVSGVTLYHKTTSEAVKKEDYLVKVEMEDQPEIFAVITEVIRTADRNRKSKI